jgi:hypothetical protein
MASDSMSCSLAPCSLCVSTSAQQENKTGATGQQLREPRDTHLAVARGIRHERLQDLAWQAHLRCVTIMSRTQCGLVALPVSRSAAD